MEQTFLGGQFDMLKKFIKFSKSIVKSPEFMVKFRRSSKDFR